MRITNVLLRQHIGHMFKKHWLVQGVRTPVKTTALIALEEKGLPIVKATDLVYPKKVPLPEHIEDNFCDPEPPLDETHPLYKERKCHTLGDSDVLVTGVPQAQVLTKTLVVPNLPEKLQQLIDSTEISAESDLYIKNTILSAHLFDAQQVKLPKRKDVLRPAYNFPRDYGISEQRKNRLITAKFLLECENLSGHELVFGRKVSNNLRFVLPFEKNENFYQFEMHADTAITTKKPLNFDTSKLSELQNQQFPDLYPMKCNLSIPTSHFYKPELVYPITRKNPYAHLHTIFVHYTTEDVYNLHGTPVTPTQYEARNMLKAFTAAATRARTLYGPDVKDLPSPINVQTIQISGNEFQFGVFQLNTLNLDTIDGEKNVWFRIDPLKLYDDCKYLASRPRLNGFNPDVFRTVYAFYRNQ